MPGDTEQLITDACFSTYTLLTTVVNGSENQQSPYGLPFKCRSQSTFAALSPTKHSSVVSKHASGGGGGPQGMLVGFYLTCY